MTHHSDSANDVRSGFGRGHEESGPAGQERRKTPEDLLSGDGRFAPESYSFLLEALELTFEMVGERRHVSGRELLNGIRKLAHKDFAMLAPTVFRQWGINCSEDLGALVFEMVQAGMLRKTSDDTLDDFLDGLDFDTAFQDDFEDAGPEG